MTKMRVHELAKELNMENREILDMLKARNIEVKNHMSTLEDDVTESIRKEVQGRKDGGKKTEAPEKEQAPKKKNLAFVVRPQNSRNSSRIQGKRPGQRPARPAQGSGKANGENRPPRAAGGARPTRQAAPAGTRSSADRASARAAVSAATEEATHAVMIP